MTILFTGELNVKIYVNEVGPTPDPKNTVFNADPGEVIHQAKTPLNAVDVILPKPDAVIVIPLIIVEDPKPGKVPTVAHIGQTGVEVGVGIGVVVVVVVVSQG